MFETIRPYNDQEAVDAFKRISESPYLDKIALYLFPEKGFESLKVLLRSLTGISQFQTDIMRPAVESIIKRSTDGLTYDGLEYFEGGKNYLLLSAHRDIVLDPAFIQYILKVNDMPLTEITAGDNLIANDFIADLMKSNRMITVHRSGTPRELYASSVELSTYIRKRINDAENPASVWIAHRSGRSKTGFDHTDQGLLKMLSMSGSRDFTDNIRELHIMPVSVSYEIESCDFLKAVEVCVKESQGVYHKRPGEDTNSILTGIMQPKGRVHITFCKPISDSEIEVCSKLDSNDRFRALADIVDMRIHKGYKLWPTNIAAARIAGQLDKIPDGITRESVLQHLLDIYSNPAVNY